ncbi:MAG: replication-relaxation family protein [Anaerolineaceae bacterium]
MEKEHSTLPRYRRVSQPPPMHLTERDQHILEAIQAYDGLLSFSQIQRKLFTCKSQTERRMMLLYQHKYVNRPNYDERRRLPEMIYWLDKRGAELVASLNATALQDLSWRKEPRWFQVEHDLAVNDFRLSSKPGFML